MITKNLVIKIQNLIMNRKSQLFKSNPDIAIYADDTFLHSKCDQTSDLWQQLEFDLQDTVDWGRKWHVIGMLEKLSWFNLTSLIALVLLMWKWVGLLFRKNRVLRSWGWILVLNWFGTLTLSLSRKPPPRKLEPWFILWSFFLLRLFCISINIPYGYTWNVVMPGLVFLGATWNC